MNNSIFEIYSAGIYHILFIENLYFYLCDYDQNGQILEVE